MAESGRGEFAASKYLLHPIGFELAIWAGFLSLFSTGAIILFLLRGYLGREEFEIYCAYGARLNRWHFDSRKIFYWFFALFFLPLLAASVLRSRMFTAFTDKAIVDHPFISLGARAGTPTPTSAAFIWSTAFMRGSRMSSNRAISSYSTTAAAGEASVGATARNSTTTKQSSSGRSREPASKFGPSHSSKTCRRDETHAADLPGQILHENDPCLMASKRSAQCRFLGSAQEIARPRTA